MKGAKKNFTSQKSPSPRAGSCPPSPPPTHPSTPPRSSTPPACVVTHPSPSLIPRLTTSNRRAGPNPLLRFFSEASPPPPSSVECVSLSFASSCRAPSSSSRRVGLGPPRLVVLFIHSARRLGPLRPRFVARGARPPSPPVPLLLRFAMMGRLPSPSFRRAGLGPLLLHFAAPVPASSNPFATFNSCTTTSFNLQIHQPTPPSTYTNFVADSNSSTISSLCAFVVMWLPSPAH